MNREEKAESIREIEARLDTTDTIIAADFRGLSVLEISALRSSLREVDAQMTVVKNTLARRAVSAKDREVLLPYLTGPTGLVWVHGDAAVAERRQAAAQLRHDQPAGGVAASRVLLGVHYLSDVLGGLLLGALSLLVAAAVIGHDRHRRPA